MRLALHAVFTLVFVMMAAIQLNDPDPTYWIAVYALVAAIPAARIFGRRLPGISVLTAGMVLAGMLIAGPGFIDFLVSGDYASINDKMSAEKPYVESAREFIGLLMAAVCLIAYAGPGRR
ncbi:MAG TPA: transmembrane 220 family protein [Burkholderiales bacterium]|nr:transmembrane 220 family protein [Burkholderiales bacterium]